MKLIGRRQWDETRQRWFYSLAGMYLRRVWLALGLVGKMTSVDYRIGPLQAWEMASILWSESDVIGAAQ